VASQPTDRGNWINALLGLLAAYGLLMGILGLPVGLFVGPQILIAALVHLAVGTAALYWLVRRSRNL